MLELLKQLLTPDNLRIFGAFGVLYLVSLVAIYKLFQMYAAVQEKRIEDNRTMQKEYYELAADINKTLEILIRVKDEKRNHE